MRRPASTEPTCTTRRPWPAPSRCCGRYGSRWPATPCTGGSASSTARPTTSWPGWDPVAWVREAYNGVFVEAESAGRLMFYGAGAGGTPTASAVLGDIVAVARNRLAGTRGPDASTYAGLPVVPMGETLTRYHVSLDVDDKPGVPAPVAEAYPRHDVSIQPLAPPHPTQ